MAIIGCWPKSLVDKDAHTRYTVFIYVEIFLRCSHRRHHHSQSLQIACPYNDDSQQRHDEWRQKKAQIYT